MSDEWAPLALNNNAQQYPPLSIPGFTRCQTASYVALKLPYDWWLCGLDCEVGALDIPQQAFFKEEVILRRNGGAVPKKLIVATAEPTTVSGKRAKAADKTSQAFADLGLDRPFLSHGQLTYGRCRLDVAGDTHRYERYSGTKSAENYASVVSGLGGAFLHPTQTDVNEVVRQSGVPSSGGFALRGRPRDI